MKPSTILRWRRVMLAPIVAALGAILPVPALAATVPVQVEDNYFSPGRIAVKPGDSVSWTNQSVGEEHSLRFDGEQASVAASKGWTFNRGFQNAGAFPYYCEIHGAPGGAGMAGVVYVNAAGDLPPSARLTVSPGVPLVRQSVSFDAASSTDTDGTIKKYEWDFDGNGSYDETTTAPTVSHSYASPATLSVKLRVTDDKALQDVTTQSLTINAVPPTASFTASPNPVQTGQAVGFDAGGSSDADGTIAQYEWDLDGNGAFETMTTSPTVSYSYLSPATLTVTLRVTDSDGAKAETTRSVQINAAPAQQQPTPVPQKTSQPQPTPKPSSTSTKGKPGKCSKLKGKKRAACIKKSCRKLKGAKMKACVKKVTRKS